MRISEARCGVFRIAFDPSKRVSAIVQVVRAMGAKGRAAPPLGSRIIPDEDWEKIACTLHLSRRHLQIARATFDRSKESAIASNLDISEHTVRSHVKRLHRRLGVTDRVDLVLLIFQVFRALPISSHRDLPSTSADVVTVVAVE